MRAIVLREFGQAAELGELPVPEIGPEEFLVRVAAASVNAFDWKIAAGMMANNFEFAFPVTIGRDFAGEIVAAGERASGFAVGDQVFGYLSSQRLHQGSLAEYLPSGNACMTLKPAGLEFRAAAALPLAGMTAMRCVTQLELGPGKRLLVVGASGGVGSFIVQLAARAGASVLATGHTEDAEFLRSLGAAAVIDHRADVAAQVAQHAPDGLDAVIDLVNRGDDFVASARLTRAGGAAVSTHRQADEQTLAQFGVRAVNAAGLPDQGLLEQLGEMAASGQLTVPISGEFTLDHGAQALEFIRVQHVRGKYVVTV